MKIYYCLQKYVDEGNDLNVLEKLIPLDVIWNNKVVGHGKTVYCKKS
jgi:hypothetical protein